MVYRILVLIFCLALFQESISQTANKPILLVFSGSDWCQPCIRFKKEVLDDPAFEHFAKNRFSILKADFPQHKELSAETIERNEKLAEKYNPQGKFPHILLLDNTYEPIQEIPYTRQQADEFIKELTDLLPAGGLTEYKKRIPAMGSFFEFVIVDSIHNRDTALQNINECIREVNRIENLISEWKQGSEVSLINRNAGVKPVAVSTELYQLIERAIQIGDLTQGSFDITFHALDGFWRFDGTQSKLPDSAVLKMALEKVGYEKIQLFDSLKVFLPVKGMSIGFGGIGQGYAVDRLKNLLNSKGVDNYLINSSGDIYAKGTRADGDQWKIGIADPFDDNEMIKWLRINEQSVVTSGNYEKYFEYNGVRYAHIINPRTGWPTQGIVSATVISPYTEVSDALATAIFVLGVEVSLNLINQLPKTHCIIIDDKKNVFFSDDLITKN